MRKYGASPVVAIMRDTYGGSRLYSMYADMSIAEVIALLAEDFGMVEYCEGEVVK